MEDNFCTVLYTHGVAGVVVTQEGWTSNGVNRVPRATSF